MVTVVPDQAVLLPVTAGFVNFAFAHWHMQDQRWLHAQGSAQLDSCYPRVGFPFAGRQ